MHGEGYSQLRCCGRMSAVRHHGVGAGPLPPGLHPDPGGRAGCVMDRRRCYFTPVDGAQVPCEIHNRSMATRKVLETLVVTS